MATYQRLVSYLYEYKQGEKGTNAGYAKLEMRENIAKLILRIRMRHEISGHCPVALYYWEGRQAYRVPVGEILLTDGCAQDRLLLPCFEISSLTAMQMNGILIQLPESTVCDLLGSAWDEQGVPALPNATLLRESPAPFPPSITENETESEGMSNQNETDTVSITDFPVDSTETSCETNAAKTSDLQTTEVTSTHFIDYFFEHGAHMYPFEDSKILRCVRIEPADLEYLPKDLWILGSNSFLLHGYYTYGHLILAEKQESGNRSYLLGVPGFYQSRERFLAEIFGFHSFQPVKKTQTTDYIDSLPFDCSDTGSPFGYWYMSL